MSIIQLKTTNKYDKGTRSPLILQLKTIYIQENKANCLKFFVEEWYNYRDMHKKHPNSKYFSPAALQMADDIKARFGYSEKTGRSDILFHFRKLFFKLYPEHSIT